MKTADTDKMIQFLKDKWQDAHCPLCGMNHWNVTGKYFKLIEFDAKRSIFNMSGSDIIPVVPVTCSNCGNTVFVNAIVAGLVDRKN